MMLIRYFLQLSYKGTHYFGWQIQPNQISVQEEIERALTQLNSNRKTEVTGCGRTDTGVHASDYFAHFDSEHEFDLQQLQFKLNLMLPKDIAIKAAYRVDAGLHARFSAFSRTYEYHIHTLKDPFFAEISWLHNVSLNLDKINSACALILRQKNFKCFSKVKTDVTNFNCDIYEISWTETNRSLNGSQVPGFVFRISANRFLRNMVRAMVGTLLEVGTEKITLDEFEEILQSGNRSMAGKSVPGNGLTLVKVDYPSGSF